MSKREVKDREVQYSIAGIVAGTFGENGTYAFAAAYTQYLKKAFPSHRWRSQLKIFIANAETQMKLEKEKDELEG